MARKTKTITLETGRDEGKSFLITEMPVTKIDRWANKALCNLLKAGIDPKGANIPLLIDTIDPKVKDSEKIDKMGGMLELARILGTALGGIDHEVLQDLKDELLECVKIIPTGGVPRDPLDWDNEIDDPLTLDTLRKEVFLLHIDFLAEGSSQT